MSIREGAKRRKQLADRKDAIRNLAPMPQNERSRFNITDVKNGGYINFGNKDYLVEGVSLYQEHNWKLTKEKDSQSFELDLLCLKTGERTSMEWEKDDEVESSLTLTQIKMSQLLDDAGAKIDKDDLDEIVEEEDSVFFNGKEYEYEDDWAAMYYRDCGEKGIRVRFIEFEAKDGESITIEAWMDGPPGDEDTEIEYEVFTAQPLDTNSIEVLSLGTAQE